MTNTDTQPNIPTDSSDTPINVERTSEKAQLEVFRQLSRLSVQTEIDPTTGATRGSNIKKKPYCFGLAIDGGGIRGLIPIIILKRLEQLFNQKFDEFQMKRLPLNEIFDLVGGTSIGGITALAVANGNITIDELITLIGTQGDKIFKIRSYFDYFGVNNPRYTSEELSKLLVKKFKDSSFGDTSCKVLVTAATAKGSLPRILTNIKFETRPDYIINDDGFSLVDAALSTSAAPTFFEAHKIKREGFEDEELLDGGIWVNNMSALLARMLVLVNMEKKYEPENIVVLSLGTGQCDTHISPTAGKLQVADILDGIMQVNNIGVHISLQEFFPNTYYRVNPHLDKKLGLDDTKTSAMNELYTVAGCTMNEHGVWEFDPTSATGQEIDVVVTKFVDKYFEVTSLHNVDSTTTTTV